MEFSHAYTAKYAIGSYETNQDWVDGGNGLSWIRDMSENFVPHYDAASVTLSEQFNPFLQISATFINNLTTTVATNKSRTIVLGLSSNQITETYSSDWSINLGYRFDNLNFVFGNGKNAKQASNDLNLTLGLSRRDTYTILRKIEELSSELSSGTRTTAISFTADYALTSKFSMQFYYDQSIANPYVSSSYPTNNINVGVSFQLSLAQ